MGQPSPAAIGRRYNTVTTRNEASYAKSIAQPRLEKLIQEGIHPETLVSLETRVAALDPLDRAQAGAGQRSQALTDRLVSLLDQSVGRISTVYNLAGQALGQGNPALESLPGRDGSRTVASQSAALLQCAAFVREHAEAFAQAKAPPRLADELERLEADLVSTSAAQEEARVAAEDASSALFVCRGEIYLICKGIYSAGRNALRKKPEEKALFAMQHMKKKPSGKSAEPAGEEGAPAEELTASSLQVV